MASDLNQPETGKVLRAHLDPAGYEDLGRVIFVDARAGEFFIIPLPTTRGSRTEKPDATVHDPKLERKMPRSPRAVETELRAPRRLRFAEVQTPRFSFVEFSVPTHWNLSEQDLAAGSTKSDIVGPRADISQWLTRREKAKSYIASILQEWDTESLLQPGVMTEVCARQAQALNISKRVVQNTLLRHMLACGHQNGLLPGYANTGGRGKVKFSAKKVGRKRDQVRLGRETDEGFNPTESDREKLAKGYRDYKKPGVSVYDAYLRTCEEYWPGAVIEESEGRTYVLAPPLKRPTQAQFESEAERQKLSASRINMGEIIYRENKRAQRGTARDGVLAVGQLMLIDATSEDQTPVSELNINDLLPSTWRTVVWDVYFGYIFGVHSGFENPSNLTGLKAIYNAGAADKVEFCRKYGKEIEPRDWYSWKPKRVRGDHGADLKGETSFLAMTDAETSLEFTRSYGASWKGGLEAGHRSLHKQTDHKNAGSTQGRQRQRGEPSRDKSACRTHFQNMGGEGGVIDAILRHNNEEIVDDLLTVEMRADGVYPTRQCMLEWCIAKGYYASEPITIDELRIRCLPRLKGRISQEGVLLFDPRTHNAARLVKHLVYSSLWLVESGLCERAVNQVIPIDVHLDPNDLSCCFFFRQGQLRQLDLRTRDPLIVELTLCEYLLMTDGDKEVIEELRATLEEGDARRNQGRREEEKVAKKAREAARQAAASAKKPKHEKRKNKSRELEYQQAKSLGLDYTPNATDESPGEPTATSSTESLPQIEKTNENSSSSELSAISTTAALMEQLRARRRGSNQRDT